MKNTPARAGNRPVSGVFFTYEVEHPLGISTHKRTLIGFRRTETLLNSCYYWVWWVINETIKKNFDCAENVHTVGAMKNQNKVSDINIRVSKNDKLLIKKAAREDGLSMSAYLIRLGKERARELGVRLEKTDHPNQIIMEIKHV